MSMKNFWMDVLRSAAILGVVMAISHMFEQHILIFSDIDVVTSSIILMVEYLVSIAIFIWLLYRFTRNVASNWNDMVELADGRVIEIKFTYSRALSYILLVSMLAGLVVGVANTIFIDIKGFDAYVVGIFSRLYEVRDLVASASDAASEASVAELNKTINEYVEAWESVSRPSMFSNILSHMSNYMFSGGFVGLLIAYLSRRNIKKNNVNE